MFWVGLLVGFLLGLIVGAIVTNVLLQKQFDDMGDYNNRIGF